MPWTVLFPGGLCQRLGYVFKACEIVDWPELIDMRHDCAHSCRTRLES
jgi:hypothetical protein